MTELSPIQKGSAMHGESGYERREGDAYYTEPWVTRALIDNWNIPNFVWEPAAGRGDMANVLGHHCLSVRATDISGPGWVDFMQTSSALDSDAIITNPPYAIQDKFIRHALGFDVPLVAMLLRNEFDSAKKRADLFKPPFACKLVLTKRPRWDWWETDKPKASPRHNFAWFIWDRRHEGEPIMRWAP